MILVLACTSDPATPDSPAPSDDTGPADDSGDTGHTGDTAADTPLKPGWWEGAFDTVTDGCGHGLQPGSTANAFFAPSGESMILDGTVPLSFINGTDFVGSGVVTLTVPEADCTSTVQVDVLGYFSDPLTITKFDRNESYTFEGADCASQPGGGQPCDMFTSAHLAWAADDPPQRGDDTGG